MYYLFYFIFEVKTKTEYMTCLYGSNLNDTRLDIKNQDLKTEDKFKSNYRQTYDRDFESEI